MNKIPYNAGHLLIIPFAHINTLILQDKDARIEQIELVTHAVEIVKNTLGAHGVNVGINLGKAAGTGIPSHLHTHVLPRWERDTNFLPALAETKTISFDLHEIYKTLKPIFKKLTL
jgi:ATP adenylyltransferase